MYTLLLVDDEEEVTQIIAKKVKWNELGFSVVGHANNGLKALEMLEEIQPDVVMTDIRMPYMDGLELCGQIREKYPATKLVLFTGFDDFEYAKEAVHLEIEEYILKPLNAAEITKVFEDLNITLTCSIGAFIVDRYTPYLEAFERADLALYCSKYQGKNQCRIDCSPNKKLYQ